MEQDVLAAATDRDESPPHHGPAKGVGPLPEYIGMVHPSAPDHGAREVPLQTPYDRLSLWKLWQGGLLGSLFGEWGAAPTRD